MKAVPAILLILAALVRAVPACVGAAEPQSPSCAETRMELADTPERCPCCGHSPVAVIMYGLPLFTRELEDAIKAGELELGGCMVTEDAPLWKCARCGAVFYPAGK